MPLKVNIGLSRKVGEANYGSRGASVNVEMELDSALVSEPAKLQDRIRQLFSMVRSTLTEELNGGAHHGQPANGHDGGQRTTAGAREASSPPAGQRDNGSRRATPSQVKAIYAISRSKRINLSQLLRERFQVNRADDLSLSEASLVIDELKSAEAGSDR
jgi:hypothetical protein